MQSDRLEDFKHGMTATKCRMARVKEGKKPSPLSGLALQFSGPIESL